MDVEGFELPTLIGSQKTLLRDNPFLVIALYHKPFDLWRIPLYLSDLGLKYSFYLRTFAEQTFETFLFAVPKGIDGDL